MAEKKKRARTPKKEGGNGLQRSMVGRFQIVAVFVALSGGAIFFTSQIRSSDSSPGTSPTIVGSSVDPSLDQIIRMRPEELAQVDVATVNLLCAKGLAGAENLDIKECLCTLDRWASIVKWKTENGLTMYYRDPRRFRNMEGFYRMQMLITVVKKDLGMAYSPDRTNDESVETFFANSKDLFLNGLLLPPHAGTCASLPVLFVAVGRRLGYPLKLVASRGHLFARWESADGKDRFNIEGTNGGMTSHPDEYYTKGLYAWSNAIFESEGFLQSMTARQELAAFLETRGMCLRMSKRFLEERKTLEICAALRPKSKIVAAKLKNAVEESQLGKNTETIR